MVRYIHLHARLSSDLPKNVSLYSSHAIVRYMMIMLLLFGAILFGFSTLRAAPLSQGPVAPALSISTETIDVMNDSTFPVSVSFASGDYDIASLGFSLSFAMVSGCPAFDDITDSDADGIPDAVTGLPSGFVATVSYTETSGTGRIDFSISDQTVPIEALSDGTLVTFAFGADDCRTDDGTKPDVAFPFDNVSFGNTAGQAVAGSSTDGTKTLRFNAKPTDIALTATSVNENLAKGSTVGTLSSTDIDIADLNDTHTYSLVSGTGDTDNSSFVIDGSTLKTNAVFDYETKNSYSIRVRTTDSYGGTFEQQFTITINDVNEAPTSLSLSATSVDENQSITTVVGNLSATDPDVGATFSYSLVSGTGGTNNSSFTIGGAGDAQLLTNEVFNYEVKNTYNIRVRVTDNGTPGLTFDKIFTIKINDVNDAPVANDDTIDPEDQVIWTPISISVLANDTDEDGDTLRVKAVSAPNSGNAVTTTTTMIYTPAGNFNGVVTFSYTATDDHNLDPKTDDATVTLTVVAADDRGDCNADSSINAGDFTAIVLEIFDTGNSGNWYEIYGGNFEGSPLGCDANADQQITVSDLTCTVLVAFGDDTCTTPAVMAAGTTTMAKLEIGQELAGTRNSMVNVPIYLATNGNLIAAASFAVTLDESQLAFDATDADGDGVPDAVTFHTPPGMVTMANYNRAAGRLEVAVYAVMVPMPTLADGPIATVTVRVHEQASVDEIPIDLLQASLGSDRGRSVPVEASGGFVQIAQLDLKLFLPLLQRQ